MAPKKKTLTASETPTAGDASALTEEKPGKAKASKPAVKASAPKKAAVTVETTPTNGAALVRVVQNVSVHDIERRAWEIWQREGCPDGRSVDHWLQAERELLG